MLAECSTAVVSTCRLSGWVARALWMAELLLSVPQLVKMTSRGFGVDQRRDAGPGFSRCPASCRPNV